MVFYIGNTFPMGCFTVSYMFFTYFNFYIISAYADHSLTFLLYKPGSRKDRQKVGKEMDRRTKKGQEKQ